MYSIIKTDNTKISNKVNVENFKGENFKSDFLEIASEFIEVVNLPTNMISAKTLPSGSIDEKDKNKVRLFKFKETAKSSLKFGALSAAIALPFVAVGPISAFASGLLAVFAAPFGGAAVLAPSAVLYELAITGTAILSSTIKVFNVTAAYDVITALIAKKNAMYCTVTSKRILNTRGDLPSKYQVTVVDDQGETKILPILKKDYKKIVERQRVVAITLDNTHVRIVRID